MSSVEAARRLTDRGYSCIPLPWRQKAPVCTGWQNLRLALEDLPARFSGSANIGVLMGQPSGWVVDVDLDHDLAVELADEYLPPTGAEFGRSSKPRSHRLYRVTGPVATHKRSLPGPNGKGKGAMLVELRATGCQTVFPGSMHPSGELIEWSAEGEPATVPPALLVAAVNALADEVQKRLGVMKAETNGHHHNGRSHNGHRQAVNNQLDREKVLDRASKYLAKMDPAISGSGGHDATFRAACEMVIGFGLSVDEAFQLLLAEYNPRCQPPWNETKLRRKVNEADKRPGERGHRLHEGQDNRTNPPATNSKPKSAARGRPPRIDREELPSLLADNGQTDTANAKRFLQVHGRDVRWCDAWNKWLYWDGQHWAIDRTRHVEHLAQHVAVGLWQELAQDAQHAERGALDAMVRHTKWTNSAKGITAMLQVARSESGVAMVPEEFDGDPMLLNCINGTLDLRTGKLRPHDRGDGLTKLAPVRFEPAAGCPVWEKFVFEITGGNVDLMIFLQRAAGYSLTGSTVERCLFFLWGNGRNGKSTFVATLQNLLGNYATQVNSEFLTIKQGQQHPTEVCDLAGARMAVASETEDGKRFAESMVKQITGGADRMKGRRMREDHWEWVATHKLWICGNHKPTVRGMDQGIWDRIRLVPFTVRFDPPDKHLLEKLDRERSGILNWALEGCRQWQANGIPLPELVKAATADYRRENDIVGRFIDERCRIGHALSVGATDLFAEFNHWSESEGERHLTQHKFGRLLAQRGFESDRTGKGGRTMWHGLKMIEQEAV